MNKEQFQKHCELRALWWIASATTGHAATRQVFKSVDGIGDTPMTDAEKIADALAIAQNHIRLFHESCES